MKPCPDHMARNEGLALSRRDFLRLAGVTGAGALLSACGTRPTAAKAEKVKLVLQDSYVPWFQPMVQEMLERFHTAHPDIQVFFSSEPENATSKQEGMLADMQAGTAPDVFQGCCSWFPIWAQKDYALDLRPFVEADLDQATIDEWDPAQYHALFLRDGRQYALPKYHGALALYYNKDLLDRYGVSYPDDTWDHDDYLEAMNRLTHDTDGDGQTDLWGSQMYITWDRIQMYVNAWGGHLVAPDDPKKSLIGAPEALAAQEWLRARMWDDHVMATPLDVHNQWPIDAFVAGKIAMVEDGSWVLRQVLTESRFRVGVAPLPAGPARRVTLATTDGYGIYAGTRHPEAAWELVKFLTGIDFGRALIAKGLLQPARASLIEEWASTIQQKFPDQTQGMDVTVFADGHKKGYSVVGEVAEDMAEATRITGDAWDRIFTLGQAPVDILLDAEVQIDKAQQVTH